MTAGAIAVLTTTVVLAAMAQGKAVVAQGIAGVNLGDAQRAVSAKSLPGYPNRTSERFFPVLHSSPAQALSYLNQQRIANGMPPVTEDHTLDSACQSIVANKKSARAANTTPKGPDFISGGAGGGNPGEWNRIFNPWFGYPSVSDTIFDPIMTKIGYAETPRHPWQWPGLYRSLWQPAMD